MEQIKNLLDKYFEGETSDAEEQILRHYFASEDIASELRPYRSLFAFLSVEKDNPSIREPEIPKPQPAKYYWWPVVVGIAASLMIAMLVFKDFQGNPQSKCVDTYVMVDGVCYDDLKMVGKYATQAIDQTTSTAGFSPVDALDFLDDPAFSKNEQIQE